MIKFIESYDFEWPSTFNKKKIQRKVNRIIRNINKNIESDELWKGRFYINQINRSMKPFSDLSAIDACFLFEFHDKKTGVTKISNKWYSLYELEVFGTLAWELNEFIVEHCKVWSEIPKPNKETSIDFRRKKS